MNRFLKNIDIFSRQSLVHAADGAELAAHGTDTVGVDARVEPVGADGDLTSGNQFPDLLGGAVFLGGNSLHFGGDDALSGGIHLGGVVSHGFGSFQTDF